MVARWIWSRKLRKALDLRKQVLKTLHAQRDLLPEEEINRVENGIDNLDAVISRTADRRELGSAINGLLAASERAFKPYPTPAARDWTETLLVVLVLVTAFRTFFLQPFKIPTGSMQPTLYGIETVNLLNQPGKESPGRWGRIRDWMKGATYYEMIAPEDCRLVSVQPPRIMLGGQASFRILGNQTLVFQSEASGRSFEKKIWFNLLDNAPFNSYNRPLLTNNRGGKEDFIAGKEFKKGDPVFRFSVHSGDHLFVDRLTYNFRPPERGEIVIFSTRGIDAHPEWKAGTQYKERDTVMLKPSGGFGGVPPRIFYAARDHVAGPFFEHANWRGGREQINQNLFYIKRLVAKEGEEVSIGNDRHVRINGGLRLDASTPNFERFYGIPHEPITNSLGKLELYPAEHPQDSQYSGHVNGVNAPLFRTDEDKYNVRQDHFMVFGDNTMNSLDSRTIGDMPMRSIIGRNFFVYWPALTTRFGWTSGWSAFASFVLIFWSIYGALRQPKRVRINQ